MNEENLVVRLKRFMDSEGITSTQLADRAGIPRPSLSQILSGRNKKVSDQLITLLHRTFPKLSISWLLFGEGPMKVDADEEPSVVSDFEESPPYGRKQYEFSNVNASNASVNTPNYSVNQGGNSAMGVYGNFDEREKKEVKSRKIVSITVFFDDNSFETFTPGKK